MDKLGTAKGYQPRAKWKLKPADSEELSLARCSHLEEGTLFSLTKDAIGSVSYQGRVCSEGPPLPNSYKGSMQVNISPVLVHDPGVRAAWQGT